MTHLVSNENYHFAAAISNEINGTRKSSEQSTLESESSKHAEAHQVSDCASLHRFELMFMFTLSCTCTNLTSSRVPGVAKDFYHDRRRVKHATCVSAASLNRWVQSGFIWNSHGNRVIGAITSSLHRFDLTSCTRCFLRGLEKRSGRRRIGCVVVDKALEITWNVPRQLGNGLR